MVQVNLISQRTTADVVMPRSRRMSWHAAPKYNHTGKQEEPT